jgi:uncharacterized Fe-S cluster protein YjdI
MNNGDRFRTMTNDELSLLFCDTIATIGEKIDVYNYCKFCPATDYCKKGQNGFLYLLNKEAEDN